VRSAIARRLEQLTAPCRDALQTAAALGNSFAIDDLLVTGSGGEEALIDALDEARRRQLLVEEGSDRFAFTHDKIREVLYAGMNPVRRRRLHLRIGEALLAARHDGGGRHAEVLAHHSTRGATTSGRSPGRSPPPSRPSASTPTTRPSPTTPAPSAAPGASPGPTRRAGSRRRSVASSTASARHPTPPCTTSGRWRSPPIRCGG
jgi:hypothetical protein